MLVVSTTQLGLVIQAIVESTHGMTDTGGERRQISTLDPRQLRSAALVALTVAIGETVVPSDERIVVRRQTQRAGILEVEG